MGSVAAGLASLGGSLAEAKELKRQEAIEQIKLALEQARLGTEQGRLGIEQSYADVNRRRQELEEKLAGRPAYKGFVNLGNEVAALLQDPDGKVRIEKFPLTEGGDSFYEGAQRTISNIKDPKRQQAAKDLFGMYATRGDFKGGFAAVKDQVDKYEQEDAAEARQQRTEEAAEKRQTRSQTFQRQQQARGFAEHEKLSATLAASGKNVVAADSAIKAIDTILAHPNLLTSLISASKINFTIDPQGNMQSLVSRGIKLSPAEAQVATAFAVLTEHINLLRQPLGATGFRGPEAFARLQAQRGNPLANPAVTIGVLNYTKQNLIKMQRVNQQMLGPERYNQLLAPIDEGGLDIQPEQ